MTLLCDGCEKDISEKTRPQTYVPLPDGSLDLCGNCADGVRGVMSLDGQVPGLHADEIAVIVVDRDEFETMVAEASSLERYLAIDEQVMLNDDPEVRTDGGTPVVDDREGRDESTNCSHDHDHDYREYDRDAVYIRYECADCGERREEFRSIDAGLAYLFNDDQGGDDQDDGEAAPIVTDGGRETVTDAGDGGDAGEATDGGRGS